MAKIKLDKCITLSVHTTNCMSSYFQIVKNTDTGCKKKEHKSIMLSAKVKLYDEVINFLKVDIKRYK